MKNVAEVEQWIGEAPEGEVRQERMYKLMELLGFPNRRLKIIHVVRGGGNRLEGQILYKILKHSGYDVGHVVPLGLGGIVYNDETIAPENAVQYAEQIRSLSAELESLGLGALTKSEIVGTVAILYFAKTTFPDMVIWETEQTAGNVASAVLYPIVTVLPSSVQGDVAKGVRAGVPVVAGSFSAGRVRELESAAKQSKSQLYMFNSQFTFRSVLSLSDDLVIHFEGPYRRIENVVVISGREEDKQPTAVALMAAEVLRQMYAVLIEDDWHTAP